MRNGLYMLGDLSEADLLWIAEHCDVHTVTAGQALIRAQQAVEHLFLIADGAMTVQSTDGTVLAQRTIGDVLGEMSFVEKRLPEVNVIAQNDVRIIAIPRNKLLTALQDRPDFAARFYKAIAVFLSDRLREANDPGSSGARELDEHVLDQVHVAGDRMLRLLELIEHPSPASE